MRKQFILVLLIGSLLSCQRQAGKPSMVLYENLTPTAFRERIAQAPVAYLPLGTLEWHGEHLPLGSDGMQSREFFKMLAGDVGGVVLPMLFMGPDGREVLDDGSELYGMDRGNFIKDSLQQYPAQQFDGSCYWMPDSLFLEMTDAIMKQIARAGFKIVVAHGHGPSTVMVSDHAAEWKAKYDLVVINCWGDQAGPGMGIMVDHAAMNETSLMMAFYPRLVHMEYLPEDHWPYGIGGKDPRIYASGKLGREIIATQKKRMEKKIREELDRL